KRNPQSPAPAADATGKEVAAAHEYQPPIGFEDIEHHRQPAVGAFLQAAIGTALLGRAHHVLARSGLQSETALPHHTAATVAVDVYLHGHVVGTRGGQRPTEATRQEREAATDP